MIPTIDTTYAPIDTAKFRGEPAKRKYVFEKDNNMIEEEIQSYGFIRRTFISGSPFSIIEKFYNSGAIKEKLVSFNEGSPAGNWYFFNERGKLIETRDTDAEFFYSWEDVLAYCEKNKIALASGYVDGGWVTKIFQDSSNAQHDPFWIITHRIGGEELEEITLDGVTGEMIGIKTLPYLNR